MALLRKDVKLSSRKTWMYSLDSKTIKFYRRNPVIACEELLGIKLMDSQKWILQESWNKPYVLWACSRNFGKSFLGAVFIILKAILYENQAIYIVAPVGSQSQETFTKIEEIILRKGKTSNSIKSLKDIAMFETVKSPACKTGFSHAQTGFKVSFYNGSEINSLNGNPDNNRSKRASLVEMPSQPKTTERLRLLEWYKAGSLSKTIRTEGTTIKLLSYGDIVMIVISISQGQRIVGEINHHETVLRCS